VTEITTDLDGQGWRLRVEYRDVQALIPYAHNSRTHSDEQVAQLAASIREFGFTNPVLVDGENGIIAGHGRVMAAQQVGLDQVPVIEIAHLTEQQKRAYVIADNRLAMNAGWDEAALAHELNALITADFSMGLLGFDDKELAGILLDEVGEGLTDPDDVPELGDDESVVTRAGDLWQLGRHRLLCGDSTSPQDVERALGNGLADLVWTDPPYNVDYEGADGKKIMNDKMSGEEFCQFLTDAFTAACKNTKDGGAIYIAHADGEGRNFREAMTGAGYMLKQCLVWVKNQFTMSRQDYQWQHEPILYGWKPGAAHNWYGEFNKSTVIDDEVDPEYMVQAELVALVKRIRELTTTSVIREPKPKRNGDHPTMKPVALIIRMLKNSSTLGNLVLDLFGGSGSTLIACEKTQRRAALLELDPKYCDVIIRRWQEFTGHQATLEGSGSSFDSLAEEREAA